MLRSVFWLCVVLLATPGCTPSVNHAPASPDPSGDRYISPGDMIELTVWREKDWSGQFPVEEDGTVVLPKLGRVDVREVTPDSLRKQLIQGLSTSLRNPSISVRVLRRVKVLGEVYKPGLNYVDATMSVGDALALAGGATPEAKSNSVMLIRDGKKVTGGLTVGTRLADLPLHSGDEIFVPEKTWFARNLATVLSVLVSAGGIAVAIITRPHN